MLLGLDINKMFKIRTRVVGTARIPAFQYYSFLILALFAATNAPASILEKTTTAQMTHEAKEVQIGEVVSTWTSPDPDQKMYFTYVKIKVEKTLKGKPAQEILLRQPGGNYRDPVSGKVTHQKVFGMESYQKGERGLFFIKYANDGAPTAILQTKQTIVKDEKTGEESVIRERSPDVEYSDRNLHQHHDEKSFYAVYDRKPLNAMVLEVQRAINAEKGDLKKN